MTDIIYHKLKKILINGGFIRVRDAQKKGIHHEYLRRLVNDGQLVRVDRGMYRLTNAKQSKGYSYAQVSKKYPRGVICLLSALRFHEFTTQLPWQVWMAIDEKTRLPKSGSVSMKFVRFSGKAFTEGVVVHEVDGVKVRVYNPAKTVADCFKFRNKIGLDVAMEALKEGRRFRKFTADELSKYARINRVLNVMMPYMEAIF